MRTLTSVLLLAFTALASAGASSPIQYHCIDGKKVRKSSYQELKISFQGSELRQLTYTNQMGPSNSGSYFGCTVPASRGDSQQQWVSQGAITTISFLGSGVRAGQDASVIVRDQRDTIEVTFDGSTFYFCGAQSNVPEKIVLNKNTKSCVFDGPYL